MSASKVAEMARVGGQKTAAQRLLRPRLKGSAASAPVAATKADLP